MEYGERNALKDVDTLLKKLTSYNKIFIFLDFDGTLVGLRKYPENVRLSKRASYALKKIFKNLKIITGIVSGRKIKELEFFLGNDLSQNFNLFGCHGSEIKFKNTRVKIASEALRSIKSIKLIQDIIEKKFINISSLIFEKKEKSFAVNYGNAKYSEKKQIEEMKNLFQGFEKKYPVKLLELKKVFEIVPDGITKGLAIKTTIKRYRKMLKENNYIFLCIGDDITDENLFMENKEGINIKVGCSKNTHTNAHYFLKNINEVLILLKKISYID
jgi:trehalose-phosphatase